MQKRLAKTPPKAHPRVGGENWANNVTPVIDSGSSPRGRGKPKRAVKSRLCDRLIPAWAGKTLWLQSIDWGEGAHPRVGGENLPETHH